MMKSPVIQFGQFANAARQAGTGSGGPQHVVPSKIQLAGRAFRQEFPNFHFRGASKEEDFVKITLAGKFRFTLWETSVLYEFARRKRAQSHYRDSDVLGE